MPPFTLFSKKKSPSSSLPPETGDTPQASLAQPVSRLPVDKFRKQHWRLEVDFVLPSYEDQSLVLVSRSTMRYLLLIDERAFKSIRKTDLLDRFDAAVGSKLKLQLESVYVGDMETLLLTQSQLQQETQIDVRASEQRTGAHRNFNLLIETALNLGASDVHLAFRDGKEVGVHFRVHGKLRDRRKESMLFADYSAMLDAVTAAYNSRADMSSRSHNHFDEQQHQSCSLPITVRGRHYQLRYQSIKENRGLDVVLRLLLNEAREDDVMTLSDLGYASDQIEILENAVHRSPGLLIIAGETGSGKSTTLRTLMTYERTSGKKFYSIEDPVEYIQPHVTQIPIQRKAEASGDSAFGAAARVVLRGDPDKIMPGEIRDAETCSFAKAMTETGHQVLSTVHASSCFGILQRLTSDELGMPLHAISAPRFLVALIYQKLLPSLCDHCKLPAEQHLPPEQLATLRQLRYDVASIRVAGPGCKHCKFLGTHRQTVAAEVCEINEDMLPMIAARKFWEIEQQWRAGSDQDPASTSMFGKTAMEHALYKMSIGVIDPADVESAFYPLKKLLFERRHHASRATPAAAIHSDRPFVTIDPALSALLKEKGETAC